MLVATALMSVVTYAMVRALGLQFQDQNILMVIIPLGVIGLVSVVAYLVFSKLLRLEETEPVLAQIKRIFSGKLGSFLKK
jgi:hypothetical protein